jgi:hypothetical protein
MSGRANLPRARGQTQDSTMPARLAATSGTPNSQVSRNRMVSSMPFHITPPAIWRANSTAMPSARAAAASATQAAASRAVPAGPCPASESPSRNRTAANSRKPRISAPATWTMRKFHVSIGKRGRKGRSMPVRSRIDRPLSAAM